MSVKASWFSLINKDDGIKQGEFIYDCPIITPPKSLKQKTYKLDVTTYDVIILSQICDIEHGKISYILVCPYYPLSSLEKNPKFESSVGKEILRRGNIVGLHLRNKCEIEGYNTDFLVVDFRKVYSIYKNYLIKFINKQDKSICLDSPYREHLSQAFARFFMRVGLPNDIPPFSDEVYKF